MVACEDPEFTSSHGNTEFTPTYTAIPSEEDIRDE